MQQVNIINSVLILFIIMSLGFIIRKRNILNEDINRGLSSLLINVTLPCLIISSFNMNYDRDIMIKGSKILIIAFVAHIVLYFSSYIIFYKYDIEKRKILRFITTFSNAGFMGFPILGSLYGKIGVLYGSIFNIPFSIILWSLGVILFTGHKNIKEIGKSLVNPALIAVVIGLILFRFSIKLPISVDRTFEMLGDMTTPVSMLVIGAMLAERSIKETFSEKSIYFAAIVRLIIIPVGLYLILNAIGIDKMVTEICVILLCMPAATLTAILAEKYNGDAVYASQNVFISTLLSVITIPLIVILLGI